MKPKIAEFERICVVDARPETARLVEVALVVVELLATKVLRVVEPVDQKLAVLMRPELERVVVVALVVVLFVAVNDWRVVEPLTSRVDTFERVDEAVEINPFKNARVVEVAFSPEASVVNGNPNELPQPVQLVTVKFPIDATFARRSVVEALVAKMLVEVALVVEALVAKKLVEVAFVVVPFDAVKDWRVVEPRKSACPVVVAPPKIVRPEAVVLLPMVDDARE